MKTIKKTVWHKSAITTVSIIAAVLFIISLSTGCDKNDKTIDTATWIDRNCTRIQSANIRINDIDYTPIINAIGKSDIIGLGEATHGTTEFWGIRNKLTKYLIENKGYKAVLIEAPFPNMLFIDKYVFNREGAITEAHSKLGYWKYREMQELITMISDYNLKNPDDKVHFYGYDCGFTKWTRASEIILDYLEKVDPNSKNLSSSYLAVMNISNAESILRLIELNRENYIESSSIDEYRTILLIAKNLPASVIHKDLLVNSANPMEYRDKINFNNVQFIMDSLLTSRKVIIWAHNAHVSNGYVLDFDSSFSRMLGSRLREEYGDQYFNICTEFYKGRFWSWDECDGHDLTFIEHDVRLPKDDYYSYYFNKSKIPIFFIDFNDIDFSGTDTDWLKNENRMHVIGGTYCIDKDNDNYYSQEVNITEYFNALFFFKETNPTFYLPEL